MASILGFTVIQEDGSKVYSCVRDSQEDVVENLIPNLLSVLQMLAKDAIKSSKKSEIKSLTLADTVFTIRNLDVKSPSRKENRFHFVLLSEPTKELSDVEAVLEHIMISFLGYNQGEFMVKLRINATDHNEYAEFHEFVEPFIGKKISDVKKNRETPPPASFVQGMLNSIIEYIQPEQIVPWNDKLVSLGQTYVWVSEELTTHEADKVMENIKEHLPSGLYDKMVERVNEQLE